MRLGSEIILTFLLNALWQVALIAALASTAAWLLRNCSARYRHAVWSLALAVSFLLPAFTSVRLARSDTHASLSPATSTEFTVKSQLYADVLEVGAPIEGTMTPGSNVSVEKSSLGPLELSGTLAVAVISLYGLFVLHRVRRLWCAWQKTRATVRDAKPFEQSGAFRSALNQCLRMIPVPRVRFLSSRSVDVPVTAGIKEPVVILPNDLLKQNDQNLLISAIGHELVHVARRDYLWNLICELTFLPLSFHPAAAVIRRQIQRTRELCCDERVTTQLMSTQSYAQSLVRLIGAVPVLSPRALDTTIGIAEWDNLEVRIMSLLKRKGPAKPPKRTLLLAGAIFFIAPCVAAANLALTLKITEPEPKAVSSTLGKSISQQEPKEVEQKLLELRNLEQALTKQAREAPLAQRPALEKRLIDVQRVLAEHERIVTKHYEEQLRNAPASERPQMEKRLLEVQEHLLAHERLVKEHYQQQQALATELKQSLAKLERQTPRDERLIQSLKDRLADLEMVASQDPQPGQELNRDARTIYRVTPSYPVDAKEKGINGPVRLTITVNPDGTASDIRVEKPLYPSADQAAREAVQRMRFAPALRNGQPVAQRIGLEFYFGLETAERGLVSEGELSRAFLDRERSQLQESRQSDLAREAVLSMDSAIQIATSKYPGKVVSCSLGREKNGPVFYHVEIVNHEGEKMTTRYVWVSAVDGAILRTEDGARAPSPKVRHADGTVWNHRAIRLPPPAYPKAARDAQASGSVVVEVVIDEQGDVISATAVSGHPLLRDAAVEAARHAKFATSQSAGGTFKATGRLVYNFVR